MKRETALALIERYTNDFELSGVWTVSHNETLTQLWDRFPADGSTEKAMRWLGFAQGAAYALGMYSLEEIKEHSRIAVLEELDGTSPTVQEIQEADRARYAADAVFKATPEELAAAFKATPEELAAAALREAQTERCIVCAFALPLDFPYGGHCPICNAQQPHEDELDQENAPADTSEEAK